jgi:hypothetical protein
MSDFEFVSVILSIVVGLGITRVLGGLASMLRHRATMRSHWVTALWAVDTLLWQILYWLGTVNSYRHASPVFTMVSFATLLAESIALYFAASLILPDEIGPATDLEEHFAWVRRPFYLVLASIPILEALDTLSHGVATFMDLGWAYGGLLATFCAGALLGFFRESRRVHMVLSLLACASVIGWLLARFYLI